MRLKTGILALATMMVAAAPLWAEQAPAARDFTFKRISVADSKPGNRITVQIDPAEQARLLALAPKAKPRPAEGEGSEAPPTGTAVPAAPLAPAPKTTAAQGRFLGTGPTAAAAGPPKSSPSARSPASKAPTQPGFGPRGGCRPC